MPKATMNVIYLEHVSTEILLYLFLSFNVPLICTTVIGILYLVSCMLDYFECTHTSN